MRKFLLVGLGLCLFGALWRAEEEEDGTAVALSPFLAALALEGGIFMLRRHQGSFLGLSPAAMAGAQAATRPILYVANSQGDDVTVIYLATQKVMTTIKVGSIV